MEIVCAAKNGTEGSNPSLSATHGPASGQVSMQCDGANPVRPGREQRYATRRMCMARPGLLQGRVVPAGRGSPVHERCRLAERMGHRQGVPVSPRLRHGRPERGAGGLGSLLPSGHPLQGLPPCGEAAYPHGVLEEGLTHREARSCVPLATRPTGNPWRQGRFYAEPRGQGTHAAFTPAGKTA